MELLSSKICMSYRISILPGLCPRLPPPKLAGTVVRGTQVLNLALNPDTSKIKGSGTRQAQNLREQRSRRIHIGSLRGTREQVIA